MFTISPNITFAQKQGDVWCFGDSALVDWTNPDNPIIGTSAIDSRGSCSSVSTPEGDLLFYVGDKYATSLPAEYIYANGRWGVAYNRFNQVMPNGYILIGEAWIHEHIILPFPNHENKYYIISIAQTGQGSDTVSVGIYYSIVDMMADSGRGDVIIKNQLLYQNNSTSLGDKQMSDNLMALQHGNGRDWWIFNTQLNWTLQDTAYFVKFLLSPTGIALFEKNNLSYTPDTTYCGAVGELVISRDGNKMMFLSRYSKLSEYVLNRCSGLFELERVLYVSLFNTITNEPLNETFFGCLGEYSPNGKLFYLNVVPYFNFEQGYTYQLNLDDIEPIDTKYLLYDGYGRTDFENEDFDWDFNGELKVAPNGKIYQSTWSASAYFNWPYPDTAYFNEVSQNLSVINHPDSLGMASDFQLYNFPLGGNRTYIGLPNNPNYRLGPLDGSPCDTLGINALQEIKPSNRPRAFTYPNPAKEMVWLSIGEKAYKVSTNPPRVTLYDTIGKKVFETKVQQLPTQLNISKLPSGVYSGRLTFSGAEYYFKVVKE